ncbi:MAG: N-acyl homoserine lactonase family protein [Desulfobacterales bacterium]|nr:N-acyl homoserine lactonase family protein [Desulfobacterales bacterium]
MKGNIHFNKKSPDFKSRPVDRRFNPVYAFLVRHPKKGNLLLDTGLCGSFAEKRFGNFGWLLGRIAQARSDPAMDSVSRMASLGLAPGDLDHILLSHLHLDHPSGLPQLKGKTSAPVYVDEREAKAASGLFALFQGYIRSHLDGFVIKNYQYRSPVAPFDEVMDFFGDGSAFVIATPGHSPGHVSVLLNAENGPIFLTFDAAHRRANLEDGIPPIGDFAAGRETLVKIRRFKEEFPDMRFIFSHDPDQMGEFPLAPDPVT